MKKIITTISYLLLVACTTTTKEPVITSKSVNLDYAIKNPHFENVNKLPREIKLEDSNVKSYTIGVLKAKVLKSGSYEIDNLVNVKSVFYTYSTQKLEYSNLDDENRIHFKSLVTFYPNSIIEMRSDIYNNKSDFLIFDKISTHGELLLHIKDISKYPRYKKLPILMLPKEAIKLDVRLVNEINIKNVRYELEKEIFENYVLISLTPKFINEEQALFYKDLEIEKAKMQTSNSETKKDVKLAMIREKITIFKTENELQATSNIIDFYTR